MAGQGNWQKVWFNLAAGILPKAEEMEQILALTGREWVFILDQVPDGWALVIISAHLELSALEPPAYFTFGKQKYGDLRISTSRCSEEVNLIAKRARARCKSTCETCGVAESVLLDIWGYMCVSCKPCGLSGYARRLKRDQKSDGSWSLSGKRSYENIAVKNAVKMVEVEDGDITSVGDDVMTTMLVCCFLDNLITQLAQSGASRQYLQEACSMRCAAETFLRQATLHGKDAGRKLDMKCSIVLASEAE